TKLQHMDTGFSGKNVFTARIGFPSVYTDTAAEWRFFDQVVERVAALPSVQSASISSGLPATRQGFGGNNFAIEGQTYLKDKDYPNASSLSVTPGFFATVKAPIAQGRAFTDNDRVDALPVLIVNKAFTKKYFPNVDPIGRRIRMGGPKSTA